MKPSGPWPSEPGPGCEVCPPGQHFLTREVDTRCTRFGCTCDRTHRCKRCPWWRCADDACFGVAWEDSSALFDVWNQCAGATRSRILDPAVTEEKPYIHSFYDNREVPWGVADGSVGPEDDPRWGAWANGFHRDSLYSSSQYQSGGRRGMTQWREGWGGQPSRSGSRTGSVRRARETHGPNAPGGLIPMGVDFFGSSTRA